MKSSYYALSWNFSGFLEQPIDRLYLYSSGFPGHLNKMAQHWVCLCSASGCIRVSDYTGFWCVREGWGLFCAFCHFFIFSRTCQVCHFYSHIFGILHQNFSRRLVDVTPFSISWCLKVFNFLLKASCNNVIKNCHVTAPLAMTRS